MDTKKIALISIIFSFVFLSSGVYADTQIKKPTNANDTEGVTTTPASAYDFQESYDDTTSEVGHTEHINVTSWNDSLASDEVPLSVVYNFEADSADADWEAHINVTAPSSVKTTNACVIDPGGTAGTYSCNLTANAGVDTRSELNNLEVQLMGIESPDTGAPDSGLIDYIFLNVSYESSPNVRTPATLNNDTLQEQTRFERNGSPKLLREKPPSTNLTSKIEDLRSKLKEKSIGLRVDKSRGLVSLERDGINVRFENLNFSKANWGMTPQLRDANIQSFLREHRISVKDFTWVEPKGFLEKGEYTGSIILPSIYDKVFYCTGSRNGPYCEFIQPCSKTSKPCFIEKNGETLVKAHHFSGAGGATVEEKISASADDAYEGSGGSANITDDTIIFGQGYYSGFRFTGVNVPQGASISNGNLTLFHNWDDAGSTDVYVLAEDTDDCVQFGTNDYNITNRPKTSNNVSWLNIPDKAWGDPLYSPNISTVIQEVVNRNGWSSGNDICILLYPHPDATGISDAISYDQFSSYGTELNITYIPPPPEVHDLDLRNKTANLHLGETLKCTWNYTQFSGNKEENTTFEWYRNSSFTGYGGNVTGLSDFEGGVDWTDNSGNHDLENDLTHVKQGWRSMNMTYNGTGDYDYIYKDLTSPYWSRYKEICAWFKSNETIADGTLAWRIKNGTSYGDFLYVNGINESWKYKCADISAQARDSVDRILFYTRGGSDTNFELYIDSIKLVDSGDAYLNTSTYNDGDNVTCEVTPCDSSGRCGDSKNATVQLQTPPSITIQNPANNTILSVDTKWTWLNITTDETATCEWNDSTSGFSYGTGTDFANTGGTNHSYNYTGLENGGSYTLYYKCNDTSGNYNTKSTVHDFQVRDYANVTLYLNGSDSNRTYGLGQIANITTDISPKGLDSNITANFRNSSVQYVLKSNMVQANTIPILMYHHIVNESEEPADTTTEHSLNKFKEEMRYLYNHGYDTITFAEMTEYINNGQQVPYKSVVLTFDDGYDDFYSNAFPVLEDYNFTAVAAIIVGSINDTGRMNQTELDEISNYGIEIASHSYNHTHLLNQTEEEREIEINQSKVDLEEMGYTVDTFIYPYGEHNETIIQEVKQYGYAGAMEVNQYGDAGTSGDYVHKYSQYRFEVTNDTSPTEIKNYVKTSFLQHEELEDSFDIRREAGSNANISVGNYDNDSRGFVSTGDAGDAVNFTIYIPEDGEYNFDFRVKTGSHSNPEVAKDKYDYILDGTHYNTSAGNLETTGPYVNDSASTSVAWGHQHIHGLSLTGGWHNLTVNATEDWGPVLDYLRIEPLSGDLEYIFNTSEVGTGDYAVYGNVAGNESYVGDSNRRTVTVETLACSVSFTMSSALQSGVNFSSVDPGTSDNPAAGNTNDDYWVDDASSGCTDINLYLNGNDLSLDGSTIGVGNVTFNQSNTLPGTQMTGGYDLVNGSVPQGSRVYLYFWLDVPSEQTPGDYSAQLKVNETGS